MPKRKKKQTLTNALLQVLVNHLTDDEWEQVKRRREDAKAKRRYRCSQEDQEALEQVARISDDASLLGIPGYISTGGKITPIS